MDNFEIFEGTLNKYTGEETNIVIPDCVTSIGDFAFYGCDHIETVKLTHHITSIGSFAFYGCYALKAINIPESVTLIGPGAFSWCKELKTMTIPGSVRVINKSTFYRCMNLKDIQLPDTITSIEHSAFGFCKQLEKIQLPTKLKHLGDNIFEECTALKSICLPDTVETLGKKAFINCSNLNSIKLSKSLKDVGEAAFQTYSTITIESNDEFLLRPRMFDEYYNFDVKSKNDGNYQFVNSYLPNVHFEEWKKIAKIILLVNFLETFDQYKNAFKDQYMECCLNNKTELLAFLMKEKRYIPLNSALENNLFSSNDLEPYFDSVTDREEKAKLMEYKNKEKQTDSIFSDLENELLNMF